MALWTRCQQRRRVAAAMGFERCCTSSRDWSFASCTAAAAGCPGFLCCLPRCHRVECNASVVCCCNRRRGQVPFGPGSDRHIAAAVQSSRPGPVLSEQMESLLDVKLVCRLDVMTAARHRRLWLAGGAAAVAQPAVSPPSHKNSVRPAATGAGAGCIFDGCCSR